MKYNWLIILFIPIIALAGDWESFSLRDNGTIPVWTVAGPFPNGNPGVHNEECFGYYKDYLPELGGERKAVPKEDDVVLLEQGKQINWKTAFSNAKGELDYIELMGVDKETPGVAYAFCLLISPKKQKVMFRIRSNDGVRVWLNHRMIHDHHVGRTIETEEDRVVATLKKGNNPLLVKVDQGGGGWGLQVAVANLDGEPVKEVLASVNISAPLKGKIKGAKVSSSSMVLKTAEGPRQLIEVEVISGALKNLVCRITKDDWAAPQESHLGNLTPGKHHFQMMVPVVNKTGPADVTFKTSDEQLELPDVILNKPREWYIYFVQHVHTDIGYTRPQTEILPEHIRFIDTALDYCDLTDNYPEDAKFRWTCEVSWPVREYLKRRPPEQIERLKRRVEEGRIEIAGMFLNMSEIATEDALAASLQPLREFKELGFPVRTAMQNDVNGMGWCLVDYFSGIGIKYVTMGINKTRSVLPFDKPTAFWWESPSGKRVLAFRPDHYHVGNFWKIHEADMEYFTPRLSEYLRSLEEKKYPYQRIAIQHSGYHTDNSPPSTKACDLVKAWNERYVSPKLRIATAQEFLNYVAKHHAEDLPVYRAAWPDWWTDGFGSAARETAEARRIHSAIQVDQGLLSIAALSGAKINPETMERVAVVQDALLFYDEHTFGAAESISDPMAENSMVQWGEKSSYVWEAVKKEGLLREEALGLLQSFLPKANVPTIAVFNTLNWRRSGLVEVFIDHEILPQDASVRIVDCETGNEIPAQPLRSRREGTYWALWAENLPPLGYKVFRIEVNHDKRIGERKNVSQNTVLENEFYKLRFDEKSGAVKILYDKKMGLNLVDKGCPWKLGQFIYEKLSQGRNFNSADFERSTLSDIKIEDIVDGPIWKSLLISANADGCEKPEGVKIEIRLYKPEKRIEFLYRIRKLRIKDAEAIYVAFPFNLPGGKIIYEAQGGFVTPGENQLPGSASDWQTIQNFAAIRNSRGQVIFGSKQVPLVQFGDINLGKWQYRAQIEKPHLYSWVMNNYWFTNFRAFQEGEFRWSYYLTSTEDNSNSQATRFAMNSATRLIPRVLPPGSAGNKKTYSSTLNLNATNVVVVTARPSYYTDAIVLHLREVEGKSATVSFCNQGKNIGTMEEVNVIEETLKESVSEINFEPFEVKFVRLKF